MEFAKKVRQDIITMSYLSKTGHIPSALSMVDYLSVIFRKYINPQEYRIILGKPFGAQSYYSIFAKCGWIEPNFLKFGTKDVNWRYIIQREHPLISFIDDTMGNTLSVACGIALANKQVYINISDASLQEGTVWEAIMFAGFSRLNNIFMTIDNNNMQAQGKTQDILDIEPIKEKFQLFGWNAFVSDGHDIKEITNTLDDSSQSSEKPTVIIFRTIKGKGISFMENNPDWHYKILNESLYNKAMKELL